MLRCCRRHADFSLSPLMLPIDDATTIIDADAERFIY